MDDLLESATRCPHCRASVRPGAPWCTLCHADLRPPPPPVQDPVRDPVPVLDPLTAPAAALGLPAPAATDPTWPCSTCGARNAIERDACASCGAGFLARLREAEGPLLEIPGVGDLTRMSRAQRTVLAFGVVLAFIVLTVLLSVLLG